MKFFKVKPSDTKEYSMTRNDFDAARQRNESLYQNHNCYGICPYCSNPVQLLGIMRTIEVSPYGKHCGKTIPSVAIHNITNYEYCIYASHQKAVNKDDRKTEVTDRDKRIFEMIRKYITQIMYIIKQDSDIYISKSLQKDIIDICCNRSVWLYPWIDEANIPWVMMYQYGAINLYGKYIKIGSPLYQELLKRGFVFEKEDKVRGYQQILKQTKYFNYSYSFAFHKRRVKEDGHLEEYIIATLFDKEKEQEILRTRIDIHHQRFHDLLNTKKPYNDQELIEYTKAVMTNNKISD